MRKIIAIVVISMVAAIAGTFTVANVTASGSPRTSTTITSTSSSAQPLKVSPQYVVLFNNLSSYGNCKASSVFGTETCHVTLMNASTTTSIQWGAASEADYTGVTGSEDASFVPSGGTLKPHASVKVAVTLSNGSGDCLN